MTNRHGLALPTALTDEIRDCGYFPDLIADAVALSRGSESVEGFLVHHEATFNRDEIQRHLSVLVLTPTRLIVGHTDENETPGEPGKALTTTESVPLHWVKSVGLSQVVANPESYGTRQAKVIEAWLGIDWGTQRRLDLLPAQCEDPNCTGDHGYTGELTHDDLTVRISAAADGEAKVRQLIDFGTQLQLSTGTTR